MTAQATRDALAEMDEWKYVPAQVDGLGANAHYWWRWTISSAHGGRTYASTHPHPPTLDGADAAVTAAGFKWRRLHDAWIAVHHDRDTVVEVPNTGETPEHKIADLYALALACRKAMEEKR